MREFADYWSGRGLFGGPAVATTEIVCSGPIRYVGQESIRADVETFTAALRGKDGIEAFLPAVAPGRYSGRLPSGGPAAM